jgi:hypothetical protein
MRHTLPNSSVPARIVKQIRKTFSRPRPPAGSAVRTPGPYSSANPKGPRTMLHATGSALSSRQERSAKNRRRPVKPAAPSRVLLTVEYLEYRDVPSAGPSAVPTYVLYHAPGSASPLDSPSPTGYTPAQIRHAYGFDQITFKNGTVAGDGTGMTIAIVDAFDDPKMASDLKAFDTQFGLPGNNTDNNLSFFTKVNQNGSTSPLPPASGTSGWAEETSLDVEWAHAVAPKAKILLVEANSASFNDLFTAVDTASNRAGVVAVSLSWGTGEFLGENSYDSHFTHANITYLVSSGDNGAPPSYPSISPNVVSVGGTALQLDGSNNWSSETGWSGSGGGVSAYESQPSYQSGVVSAWSTTQRTNPDVSYDADPNTGFPIYDSYDFGNILPWTEIGGTSDAAPQWAALIAIADQGRNTVGLPPLGGSDTLTKLYNLPARDFHDITSGTSAGFPNYTAGRGYDLVTGLGSPYADKVVNDLSNYAITGPPVIDLNWSGGGISGPATASSQTPFTVSRTYNISGAAASSSFTIAYYASTDTVFGNADDVLLGTETISAAADMTVGLHSGTSPALTIPAGGTFYLFAQLDANNNIDETNESNNVAQAPQPVVVSGPVVLDNGQPGYAETGAGWVDYPVGYNGGLRFHAPGGGADTASWQASGLPAGYYTIQATWNGSSNHASNAPYAIYDGSTLLRTVIVDQRPAPSGSTTLGGVVFQDLASVYLTSGTLRVVLSDNTDGYVVADAVRLVPIPAPVVDLNWSGGGLTVQATATTQTPFTVSRTYTVSGAAPSNSFTVAYYASTDAVFGNADDILLGTETISAAADMAVGNHSGVSPNLLIPTGGTYYLFARLDSANTVLEADETNNVAQAPQVVAVTVPIILDNGQPGYAETGSGWTSYAAGYNGSLRFHAAASGADTASWQASGLPAGYYTVQATWNGSSNHASNAPYSIYDGTTLLRTVTVDQRPAPSGAAVGGVVFQDLATVQVTTGTLRVVLSDNTNGYVVADAVRLVPIPAITVSGPALLDNGQPGYSEVGSAWADYAAGYNGGLRFHAPGGGADTASWQASGLPAGYYTVQATWNGSSNHASNAPYAIYDGTTLLSTVTVDQRPAPSGSTALGGVVFQDLASVHLTTGTLRVVLSDNTDGYVVADAVRFVPIPAPVVDLNWSGGGLSGPASASSQTPFTLSRTYTVSGANVATSFTIAYYASTDTVFGNADDILLGTETISAAADMTVGSHSGTSPALTIPAGGTFYLFALLDSSNAVPETDEGNNVVQAGQPVVVSGPVILDNGQPGYAETGAGWTDWPAGYNGGLRFHAPGGGADTASWQASGLPAGYYTVQATWNGSSNHASNAPYAIYDGTTLLGTVIVDQRPAPSGGATLGGVVFQNLATVQITTGTLRVVLSDNTDGYVVADAVYLVPAAPPPSILAIQVGPGLRLVPAGPGTSGGSGQVRHAKRGVLDPDLHRPSRLDAAPPERGRGSEALANELFWLDAGRHGQADAAPWWLAEAAASTDTDKVSRRAPLANDLIDAVFAEGEGHRTARGE